MIKVSIIVPVYNVEKYLRECLDSLIGQTLKDIEIITINDGSPDNSLQILEEYAAKDARVKVINQKNAGLSAARNRGMEAACGEYVAFIDSDDWVDVDFCERLYDAAIREKADIAAGEIISCSENGKCGGGVSRCGDKVFNSLKEKWHYLLDDGAHCYVCNKIYKRELLLGKKLFFAEGKTYEDILWSPLVLKNLGRAVLVSGVSYYYRYNPSSITRSFEANESFIQNYKEARASLVRFAGYYKLDVSFDALRRSVYKVFNVPLIKIEYGDTGFRFYFLGICCLKKETRQRM